MPNIAAPTPPNPCPEPVGIEDDRRATMRTFSLNSQEFHEAVCEPRERPWIPNGALPRDPRVRDQEVIIEPRRR